MNEVQSVALGLTIGLVIISVLSFFPGEPFDYSAKNSSHEKEKRVCAAHKTENEDDAAKDHGAPGSQCAEEASKVSACSPATPSESSPPARSGVLQPAPTPAATPAEQKQAEKERQMMKIRKLQALLGIEKHKMDELVARTNAGAIASQEDQGGGESSSSSSFSPSTRSYGAYLDVSFYVITLGLLAYVLKTEYDIDLLQIVAHMFPREVETATKVLQPPKQFLQQLSSIIQTWALAH